MHTNYVVKCFLVAIFLSALLVNPQAVFCDQEGHVDSVTIVDWHPDGTKIASGSDDGTVKIWDALDYSVISTFDMKSEVLSVQWSPDGSYLAIGCYNDGMNILDVERGEMILTHPNNMVSSVTWHPDGNKLARACTVDLEEIIEIINASTGIVLQELGTYNNSHSYNSLAWSSDGEKLAYKNGSQHVLIWVFSNNSVIQDFSHSAIVQEVAWHPDSRKIATATKDPPRYGDVILPDTSSVQIWDVINGTLLHELDDNNDIHTVTWNPDGSMVASGGGNEFQGKDGDNSVKIWNLSTISNVRANQPNMTLAGHSGEVSSVRWSPDGRKLASGSADHTIRIWNVSTGSTIMILGIEVPQETKSYPGELWGYGAFLFLLVLYGGGLGVCVCGGMFVIRALMTRTRSREYYPPTVPQKPVVHRKRESLSSITKHFCPYCGEKVIAGKFCTKCGAGLK